MQQGRAVFSSLLSVFIETVQSFYGLLQFMCPTYVTGTTTLGKHPPVPACLRLLPSCVSSHRKLCPCLRCALWHGDGSALPYSCCAPDQGGLVLVMSRVTGLAGSLLSITLYRISHLKIGAHVIFLPRCRSLPLRYYLGHFQVGLGEGGEAEAHSLPLPMHPASLPTGSCGPPRLVLSARPDPATEGR